MTVITQNRMEKALTFLAETSDQMAELDDEYRSAALAVKKIKAAVYVAESGGVEQRKALAENHPETLSAEQRESDAHLAYQKLKNKRDFEDKYIEVWRSVNSSRNRGNIV